MRTSDNHIFSIRISGPDEWQIWPWAVVRAPGFPARWVLRLAAPDAARAASLWNAARQAVASARQEVVMRLERARVRSLDSAEKKRLRRQKKQIDRGELPAGPAVPMDEWWRARQRMASARQEFEQVFARERVAARTSLRELAGEPDVRTAIAWQNHRACRLMMDRLAAIPVDRDSADSRHTELRLTSYLQRYCVKNDTIGFFGPVCWARVGGEAQALAVAPGEQLMATHETCFEDWAMTALCEVIDKDAALRPWLRPRRLPAVGLVGDQAFLFMPEPVQLGALEARILAMCDGQRNARSIAAQVLMEPGQDIASEAEVFAIIAELCKRGLAMWRVETIMSLHADELLRELLQSVADPAVRERALAPLDRLQHARDAVASAREPDAILAALDALDRTFEDITGRAPTRNPGQPYAARTLVFLDGRRAGEITVGADILDRAAPALSVFMHAARWYTARIAHSYRQALIAIYEQIAGQMKTREVPVLRLWLAAQAIFPLRSSVTPEPLQAILADLRQRWQELFDAPARAEGPLCYPGEELAARARALFHADAPGWALARHHGPDILIAAADVDAVNRGDYQIILGEFHCALNTSNQSFFLAHHPRVDDMYSLWEGDFPEPCVIPCRPREQYTVRENHDLVSSRDYRLEWAPDIAGPPRARGLAAGDLIASMSERGLVVRARDGSVELDIIEFFAVPLSGLAVNCFAGPWFGDCTPRITIDDVVIARQGWRVNPAELDFWTSKEPGERFLRARQWVEDAGIPRFCFVKTPVELKPVYVDFDSPLFIDLLAHLCRKTARDSRDHRISLTEMLPAHDQLWLVDRDGNRYTSEVRLVAVDPAR